MIEVPTLGLWGPTSPPFVEQVGERVFKRNASYTWSNKKSCTSAGLSARRYPFSIMTVDLQNLFASNTALTTSFKRVLHRIRHALTSTNGFLIVFRFDFSLPSTHTYLSRSIDLFQSFPLPYVSFLGSLIDLSFGSGWWLIFVRGAIRWRGLGEMLTLGLGTPAMVSSQSVVPAKRVSMIQLLDSHVLFWCVFASFLIVFGSPNGNFRF